MSRPSFYGEHLCICNRWVHEHESVCGRLTPDGEMCVHFNPLCCEDCPCGSFQEAHPPFTKENPDAE